MKSITIYILSALLVTAGVSSCRKAVNNIPLARTDDMAILQGFLNPETDTITISLSVASGITKDKKTITMADLQQAAVSIESDGITKPMQVLKTNESNVIFYLKKTAMPVTPGKTYTVRAANGDKFTLEASTTVPSGYADFSFEVKGPNPDQDMSDYRIKVSIQDIKGTHNYYRIGVTGPQYNGIYTADYMTDEQDTRTEISHTTVVGEYDYPLTDGKVSVSNISEAYYKFVQSLSNVDNADGNPFAEPTRLYTNVKGGTGVLGSMTIRYKNIP